MKDSTGRRRPHYKVLMDLVTPYETNEDECALGFSTYK